MVIVRSRWLAPCCRATNCSPNDNAIASSRQSTAINQKLDQTGARTRANTNQQQAESYVVKLSRSTGAGHLGSRKQAAYSRKCSCAAGYAANKHGGGGRSATGGGVNSGDAQQQQHQQHQQQQQQQPPPLPTPQPPPLQPPQPQAAATEPAAASGYHSRTPPGRIRVSAAPLEPPSPAK